MRSVDSTDKRSTSVAEDFISGQPMLRLAVEYDQPAFARPGVERTDEAGDRFLVGSLPPMNQDWRISEVRYLDGPRGGESATQDIPPGDVI